VSSPALGDLATALDLPPDVDVLIIGAGQAGLGVAQRLRRHPQLSVLVVDALPVGASWRERWESLQLFTPRRFSGLPGLSFPVGPARSPSRTEMAHYLQQYAAYFAPPVRTGARVLRLTRSPSGFCAETSLGPIRAQQVVLATGPFRRPHVPAVGDDLDPSVTQLHSHSYRRPSDIPAGEVLVVGGGNSAAQLAIELAATHQVTIASPGPLWFLPEDVLGVSVYWWTLLAGILNAKAGGRISRYVRRRGDAIVGTDLRVLIAEGRVRLLPHRVVAGRGRAVELADGTVLPVASVLWCTGFRPDTGWVGVPGAVSPTGTPLHDRGASPVPGLHWMGLPWQTRLNSSIIDGVDRDARRTAKRIRPGVRRRHV
jgi:putative flavoprotein involved in K+ transport